MRPRNAAADCADEDENAMDEVYGVYGSGTMKNIIG